METEQISKKKTSVLNLLFNYANTLFLIINGLMLVPLYFKYFSLSTYGSYLAVANIAGILGLLDFGLSLVFTQKLSVFHIKKDYKNFSKILSSGLFIGLFLFTFIILITIVLFPYVPFWVKANTEDFSDIKFAFLFSALGAGLTIYSNILASVFQAWLKVKISGFANISGVFFGIIATFLGLYLGYGVISISLGTFVKWLITFLILSISLYSNFRKLASIRIKYNSKSNLLLLKQSLPVFGNSVSKSLIDNGQLLIITNFISPTATTIFAITNKVYQVCSTVLAPIGSSIYAGLSQLVGENNHDNLKKNILKLFSIFTIFSAFILAISFSLNSSFIKFWVGEDKYGGLLLSFFLCLNVFFNSRFVYINFNLFSLGVFGKTVLYDQIGALVRLILTFGLIVNLGYIAIPLAELFSVVFISGIFVNKLFIKTMNFTKKEIFKILLDGLPDFSLFMFLGFCLNYYLPIPLTLFSFFLQATIMIFILGVLTIICHKGIRNFIFRLVEKYQKKY